MSFEKKKIHLISDSSANLIEHHLFALLTQFPEEKFEVELLRFVNSKELLVKVMRKIKNGLVMHGLISSQLKELLQSKCSRKSLPCHDLTGPSANFLEKSSGIRMSKVPRPIHTVDSAYLGRMSALEFAMQHDDSRRLDGLNEADIILVGISRVSKSPNALFLAYRGYRVANVSFVPSAGLPAELKRHKRRNVVALTSKPRRLAEIRRRRFSSWRLEEKPYEDIKEIIREVMEAEKIYRKKKWPVIDSSDLAVEETSSLVLKALKMKTKLGT